MIRRRLLMFLGLAALLAGLVLTGVWLRTPATPRPAPVAEQAQPVNVLAVVRPVRARALLAATDLGWRALARPNVPAGALEQGSTKLEDFIGAVVRRDLQPGDILTSDIVTRRTDRHFLAAVLGRDMRAVSIPVGATEGSAALILPGDRVDVLLTQNFADAPQASRRTVGETVLKNLRVIAVDRSLFVPDQVIGPANDIVTRTVTLEATQPQAEALLVAMQLGKVQLVLRTSEDPNAGWLGESVPTWGSDVSPALRESDRGTPGAPAGPGAAPEKRLEVLHGGQIEVRCFDSVSRAPIDCQNQSAPRGGQDVNRPSSPPAAPRGAPAPTQSPPDRNG